MQNEWQNFLTQQGATMTEDGIAGFGFQVGQEIERLAHGCAIMSLDHLGVIRVSGSDAKDFLQSQFSNDITSLKQEQTRSQLSAYCNPKGRILALFLVIPYGDDYFLITSRDVIDRTLMRLRMFVLRSQVTLDDVSNEQVILGLANPGTISIDLSELQHDYDAVLHEESVITRLPALNTTRYLLLAPVTQAKKHWQAICQHDCTPLSLNLWQWMDIQAGLPNVVASTIEEFVPQMLNLELIDGVNFKKGCYPGQEIVARMHYLGKAKRRMFRLSSETDESPAPGTDLYVHGGDGQSAGKVVISQPSLANGIELLAVLRLNHAENSQLRLNNPDGPQVSLSELPYPLESAE